MRPCGKMLNTQSSFPQALQPAALSRVRWLLSTPTSHGIAALPPPLRLRCYLWSQLSPEVGSLWTGVSITSFRAGWKSAVRSHRSRRQCPPRGLGALCGWSFLPVPDTSGFRDHGQVPERKCSVTLQGAVSCHCPCCWPQTARAESRPWLQTSDSTSRSAQTAGRRKDCLR